jgi:hypothetical protein
MWFSQRSQRRQVLPVAVGDAPVDTEAALERGILFQVKDMLVSGYTSPPAIALK